MIDPKHKETMQISNEASLVCLKTWPSQNGPQETGNATEGFVKLQDEMDAHAGDINDIDKLFSREGSAPVNQYYSRPFYNQQSFAWANFHSDAQLLRQNQFNIRENQFHSMNGEYNFHIENRIQYLPLKMFSQGYPTEVQFQEFQYFVVIDFEATCDKEKNPYPQEIIEFPSVLVNSLTGRLEAFFQTYVRPAYHQHLTDFCKELTGIQQFQVDRGVPLSEALFMHDKWLEENGIKHKNFAIVTWSNWDCRVMLESECRLKRIRKPPYFNRWINLKVPFQEVFGNVRCNLKEAVQMAGLAWEGRQHCGLDDAGNTARLLAYLMRRGFRFSITNSLSWQSSEDQPGDQPQKPKLLMGRAFQFHSPINHTSGMDRGIYCFCGVKSSKCMVRKPGPTQGRWFFGCGNWTASRRAVCDYFMWASP